MLDIFALIYLTGKIGNLAERKGLKKGLWKFYTVLAWFISEFVGVLLTMIVFHTDGLLETLPLAYLLAICSYFLLRQVLNQKPDVDTGFEFEQRQGQ